MRPRLRLILSVPFWSVGCSILGAFTMLDSHWPLYHGMIAGGLSGLIIGYAFGQPR
jgi:hypothetical protein